MSSKTCPHSTLSGVDFTCSECHAVICVKCTIPCDTCKRLALCTFCKGFPTCKTCTFKDRTLSAKAVFACYACEAIVHKRQNLCVDCEDVAFCNSCKSAYLCITCCEPLCQSCENVCVVCNEGPFCSTCTNCLRSPFVCNPCVEERGF